MGFVMLCANYPADLSQLSDLECSKKVVCFFKRMYHQHLYIFIFGLCWDWESWKLGQVVNLCVQREEV